MAKRKMKPLDALLLTVITILVVGTAISPSLWKLELTLKSWAIEIATSAVMMSPLYALLYWKLLKDPQ